MSIPQNVSGVNPLELTKETYDKFCRLYLIQEINNVIPITCPIQYRHIFKLINSISPALIDSLNTETGKVILLNEVYALFMSVDAELSREFLYDTIEYIVSKYPHHLS